jgi:sec-independent protein translocase protein TatB
VFDSVGWGEMLVLIVAGLFILGPERLPEAAAWLGRTIRQVREYATGARDSLRSELGPEFDELRKPLEDLRGLRSFNPRTAVRRTLFDDDLPVKPNGYTAGANGAGGSNGSSAAPQPHPATGPAPEKLAPGERPPIDPDAT